MTNPFTQVASENSECADVLAHAFKVAHFDCYQVYAVLRFHRSYTDCRVDASPYLMGCYFQPWQDDEGFIPDESISELRALAREYLGVDR